VCVGGGGGGGGVDILGHPFFFVSLLPFFVGILLYKYRKENKTGKY